MSRTRVRTRHPGRALPPGWRFLLAFATFAVLLFGLYQAFEVSGHFDIVNRAYAAACQGALVLLGIESDRSGAHLVIADHGMQIVSECTAIDVAILLAAGILAFPTTWRARWIGLGLGLPILFGANLLRLVMLGGILRFRAAWLPPVHEYFWQVFFVFAVALLYVTWIERIVPRARTRQPV